MNHKYFGNSLDLMKYDILTYLLKLNNAGLLYVPMLTAPEPKKLDPKYKLYEIGSKNDILLNFVNEASKSGNELNLEYITHYFNSVEIDYKIILNKSSKLKNTISFKDITYFTDENRKIYFKNVLEIYCQQISKTIIFIDPDVGIDIGITRRVRSMKNMYLKSDEVQFLMKNMKENDFLCFFQHIGNPKYKLEDRLNDLKKMFGQNVLIIAYERISAGFVFVFKDELNQIKTRSYLAKYLSQYIDIKHYQRLKLL